MPKMTQLTLSLESKPGVVAKIARTLADAGVNITGLSATDTTGRGKVRLLVSDGARAVQVLKAAKYRVTEETAVVLSLENRPGALAGVAEKLAQAKVNIKSVYATAGEGGRVTVVLTVPNADKALSLLGA
ncbi:MAG TPA: ACT domain-containing protein [Methylomirabilota bacterium]|jgi:hypothetical protein